ncbi:tyrosine-type recombinase/integrase [Salipiger sp. 1_MG-2023]|uniref:tyrosine-type recombinase/integrase n=1 Tax=Salipiger sp. 1_MG-2023 TaxID=3062665 RepID=UPI0026E2F0C7|nr:tyrosine-type recombinase/integrase [Salipiger sp. 1_MG-2023]MDO6588058.1 tyrosine-type recombinase/integrase [Salipiger sp. 1_MG-2023]
MGTIMQRKKKDGSLSYTAVIRKKKGGKVVLTLSETFPSHQAAKRWMRNAERDLKGKNAVERAIADRHRKTWADVIQDYSDASPKGFGKTKTANLAYLQRLDFGKIAVEDTDDHVFFTLAQDLLKGVQARPADPREDSPEHYTLKPRLPQTVNSYMATLRTVVLYGGPISNITMPIQAFETAILSLRHQDMVARSDRRTRRPSLEELDRLLTYFYARYQANSRCVPMHKIIGAAITLAHRQKALCSLPWVDVDETRARIQIRNMKHPRRTQGNNVTTWVTEEGLKIILSMPRDRDRVFPYNADAVSRLFTDACKIVGIVDLHFHDLRHEAISRFFETGLGGGSRDIIMRYTGHSPDGSLSRYIHVEQVGDKYADWKWWPVLFAPL